METKYTKLKDLVGKKFTIQKVQGYKFKLWDNSTKHMVVADKYFDGARKVYQVETDHGTLDLGTGQVGTLLETCLSDSPETGMVTLKGQTFEVKSNGKEGMEIRYFFNLVPGFEPDQSIDDLTELDI